MRNEDDEVNPFSREYTSQQRDRNEPAPAGSQAPGFGQAPVQPPTPRKSGGGNFLLWLIPLILVIVLVPVMCCGGVLFWGFDAAVDAINRPADVAVESIEADQAIVAKLGTPLERTSKFAVNNYENDNGNGGADVNFSIKGSEGSARVKGRMKLVDGVWSPDDLTIVCDDGSQFRLPADDTQADDQPPAEPDESQGND